MKKYLKFIVPIILLLLIGGGLYFIYKSPVKKAKEETKNSTFVPSPTNGVTPATVSPVRPNTAPPTPRPDPNIE